MDLIHVIGSVTCIVLCGRYLVPSVFAMMYEIDQMKMHHDDVKQQRARQQKFHQEAE